MWTRTPIAAASAMATPAPTRQYHALVIGNTWYDHLPCLWRTSALCAEAVARVLFTSGVKVTQLIDVRSESLSYYYMRFVRTLTEDCVAIVYFAGHGWEVQHTPRVCKHYLLGIDATWPSRTEDVLSNATLCRVRVVFASK